MTRPQGGPALADRLRTALGRHHRVVAAGIVSPDGTSVASLGTPPASRFEIGSISKGITGLLYVDAIDRGEVRATTTLGELLPVTDAPVARVTLGALAVHRSGLPRLASNPESFGTVGSLWRFYREGANPYTEDLADLIARARLTKVGHPKPRYSNVGFQLLGHAIAAAAGTTYAGLVRGRIATPLGLHTLVVPSSPAELDGSDIRGTSRRGRPVDPWLGEGVGPAGGIRASAEDMTRLLRSLLDGTAPGARALEPVESFGRGARIGAAWVTIDFRGRAVTWHNGGTGGFRSWAGLDREAGRAVVVLTATSRSVDGPGIRLLAPSSVPSTDQPPDPRT